MSTTSSIALSSPLTRTARAPLSLRVGRKLRGLWSRSERTAKRVAARAVYALPFLARRNPRKRVMRLAEYCDEVSESPFPPSPDEPHWYLAVRPAESVTVPEPTALRPEHATAFSAAIAKHQGGTRLEFPEVFLASVAQARIYGSDYLLLSAENRIFFESALSRPDYLEANGILDTLFFPEPHHLPGEYCLIANRSHRGYYHWLIDILPKLSLVEKFPELHDVPLIFPAQLGSFHLETLSLAGIKPDRTVRLEPGFWQADRIYFPEMLGPTGVPSPHAVSWLRRRFLTTPVEEQPPQSIGRRLYVTRRDATQRRVLNEPQLVAFLATLGFEVVCPGEMSFPAQIELFRGAEIVIAPHGAALTNMVFTPPGRTFIEFFGDNYINGCFWALAHHCQHQHAFLVGRSTWLDYEIPLVDLQALLSRLGIS